MVTVILNYPSSSGNPAVYVFCAHHWGWGASNNCTTLQVRSLGSEDNPTYWDLSIILVGEFVNTGKRNVFIPEATISQNVCRLPPGLHDPYYWQKSQLVCFHCASVLTLLLSNKYLNLGGAGKLVKITGEGRPVETRLASVLVVETNAVLQNGHSL